MFDRLKDLFKRKDQPVQSGSPLVLLEEDSPVPIDRLPKWSRLLFDLRDDFDERSVKLVLVHLTRTELASLTHEFDKVRHPYVGTDEGRYSSDLLLFSENAFSSFFKSLGLPEQDAGKRFFQFASAVRALLVKLESENGYEVHPTSPLLKLAGLSSALAACSEGFRLGKVEGLIALSQLEDRKREVVNVEISRLLSGRTDQAHRCWRVDREVLKKALLEAGIAGLFEPFQTIFAFYEATSLAVYRKNVRVTDCPIDSYVYRQALSDKLYALFFKNESQYAAEFFAATLTLTSGIRLNDEQ